MSKYSSVDLLINSALAAGLVFFGAFTTGQVTATSICAAAAGAAIVFLTRLKNASDKKMMVNQMKQEASRLSDIIRRSTYYDMLRARTNEVQEVLETIGAQEDVRKVRIIEQGRIIISSNKQEMGRDVNKKAESCYDCHKVEGQKPLTIGRYRFFNTEDGEAVLGFLSHWQIIRINAKYLYRPVICGRHP